MMKKEQVNGMKDENKNKGNKAIGKPTGGKKPGTTGNGLKEPAKATPAHVK